MNNKQLTAEEHRRRAATLHSLADQHDNLARMIAARLAMETRAANNPWERP